MEIFALFVWPGVVLGGLIAYGLFVSRRPEAPKQDAARTQTALAAARKARQDSLDLIDRIERLEATVKEQQAELKTDIRLSAARYALRGGAIERKKLFRASYSGRFVHGS